MKAKPLCDPLPIDFWGIRTALSSPKGLNKRYLENLEILKFDIKF